MARIDLAHQITDEEHIAQIVDGEEIGAQAIVDVMRIVGNIIRNGGGLRFSAGEACQIERHPRVEFEDRDGDAARRIFRHRRAIGHEQRAIVLDEALEGFPREVQAVVVGVAAFEPGDDAQGLCIVIEPAEGRHDLLQHIFARMAEGRVTKIVGERQRFREIFIKAQRTGEGAGNLAHLDRVGQAGAVVIAFVGHEDLGLVGQPAEGGGMDDPVAVALEFGACGRGGFGKQPATTGAGIDRVGRPVG